MPKRSSRSFYDKTYFESYGGTGYTWETTFLTLKPFANSIINLMSFYTSYNPSLTVLDIGCAKGYLVKMLREKVDAWGVDISDYAINNAPDDVRVYLKKVDVEKEVLPFRDQFFDLVISISTLEHLHLRRLPFTLLEIHRVLKHSGLFIINVPNPFNKSEREKPEHVTMLSMEAWIKFIEKFGFHYNRKLSSIFEFLRIKEMANLYISHHNHFQLIGIRLAFPSKMKTLLPWLMMLKRKLRPPSFSLLFSKP
jgi:SAM-dependent methyltransferase